LEKGKGDKEWLLTGTGGLQGEKAMAYGIFVSLIGLEGEVL
jgi:hypothetical protein